MKNAARVTLTTPVAGLSRVRVRWPAAHIVEALVAEPDEHRKHVLTLSAMTGLAPEIALQLTEADAESIFEAARKLN